MLSRLITSFAIIILFLVLFVSVAGADYLGDITVSQANPSSMNLNGIVEVACDWEWTGPQEEEEGIRIKAIPMTNGSISPGAYYEPAEHNSPGSGRDWPTFTIQSGDVVVDEILLTMETDRSYGETLLEMRIPASIHFGPHTFYDIHYNFESPSRMQFGQQVTVDFMWRTNHVGGHRVVIRPLTGGVYAPNMQVTGSAVLTGTSGLVSRSFTISQDVVDIDGIVFEIYNSDFSELLYDFEVPADYHFGSTAIQNIVLNADTPASLLHGEYVTIDFDFLTDYPMDPVMYAIPQTGGVHSPGAQFNPASPLPPGYGSGHNYFTIDATAGPVVVDEILFSLHDYFDEEIFIDQFRMPVYYHFSSQAIRDVQYEPKAPAILSLNSQMNLYITYENGLAEEGWLYHIPLTWQNPTPNTDGYFRSIAYQGLNPPKRHFFTVTAGPALINQMQFTMFNNAQDVQLVSYFQDVWFYFGPSAQLVPVIDVPSGMPVLEDCFPNPFNPLTTVQFELPAEMVAGLKIFDLRGRHVKTLAEPRMMTAGLKKVTWNGSDGSGRPVAAGVYLYRLEAGGFISTKLMTLVK